MIFKIAVVWLLAAGLFTAGWAKMMSRIHVSDAELRQDVKDQTK